MTTPTQPLDPLTQEILIRLRRIARIADVMRLDAKAAGNQTRAADANEIMFLANNAVEHLTARK